MHHLGTSWRVRTPEETLRQVEPYLKGLGIDGVIEHRGMGEIRVFETLRRGSISGYLNLGKGFDSNAAQVSAIMEGVEMSLVEAPIIPPRNVPSEEIDRIIRFRHSETNVILKDNIHTIQAINALNLTTGAEAYVLEADLFFQQAVEHGSSAAGLTNGLASGNTEGEAILHSVYELIERDAIYHSQQALDKCSPFLCPLSFEDAAITRVYEALANEGHMLQLRVLPSIASAYTIEAAFYPSTGKDCFGRFPGWGCSVDIAIATRRAIAEAIQVWSIYEALRDGLIPAERRKGGLAITAETYKATSQAPQMSAPLAYWYQNGLSNTPGKIWEHVSTNSSKTENPDIIFCRLIRELHDTCLAVVYCARLSPEDFPFHVVRCFSPELKCPDWL